MIRAAVASGGKPIRHAPHPSSTKYFSTSATAAAAVILLSGCVAISRTEADAAAPAAEANGATAAPARRAGRPHVQTHKGTIEADLMDHLASKPYVKYHNVEPKIFFDDEGEPASDGNGAGARRKGISRWGRRPYIPEEYSVVGGGGVDGFEGNTKGKGSGKSGGRPLGVPQTVRILAVDLPAMREAIDGECVVDLRRVSGGPLVSNFSIYSDRTTTPKK